MKPRTTKRRQSYPWEYPFGKPKSSHLNTRNKRPLSKGNHELQNCIKISGRKINRASVHFWSCLRGNVICFLQWFDVVPYWAAFEAVLKNILIGCREKARPLWRKYPYTHSAAVPWSVLLLDLTMVQRTMTSHLYLLIYRKRVPLLSNARQLGRNNANITLPLLCLNLQIC